MEKHDQPPAGHILSHCLVLFTVLSAVYYCYPSHFLMDSAATFLVAERVLTKRTFDLKECGNLPDGGQIAEGVAADPMGKHSYHLFPPGNTVLPIPFVAVAKLFGWSCLDEQNNWIPGAEIQLQKIIAALVMAATAVCLFKLSRYWLPIRPAMILVALIFLCQPIVTMLSQNCWAQTWMFLLLSLALLAIQRERFYWAACLLGFGFLCRPMIVASILPITVWVIVKHPRRFPLYCLIGVGWGLALAVWSWSTYGEILPWYYQQLLPHPEETPVTFAPLSRIWFYLLSSEAGLLYHTPILLICLLIGLWRPLHDEWSCMAWGATAIHLSVLTYWSDEGAMHGQYNTRFLLDLVPWMVVLAASRFHVGSAARSSTRPSTLCRIR